MSGWASLPLACPRCRGDLRYAENGARCSGCGVRYPLAENVLDLRTGFRGAAAYDPEHYKILEEVEERHFWFAGRRGVVLAALKRTIPDLRSRRLFDIGCGTGALLEFLAGHGVPVAGACDTSSESVRRVRSRLDIPLILVDEGQLPPLGLGHDLVGMFDVLEHLDDDLAVVEAIRNALLMGGALVLTVPAHPFLYGGLDEIAHHRRRYSRPELRRLLERAGLKVRLISHFMSPLVPILVSQRILERLVGRRETRADEGKPIEFRVIPGVNGMMQALLALERTVMDLVPVPFGSSLVAVAVRTGP